MSAVVLNFFAFQLSWFVTVYSAANALPLAGLLFTFCWVLVQLHHAGERRQAELQLFTLAGIIGYLFDSLQVLAGTIAFPVHTQIGGPSPLWMVALWVNLAATLNYSMKWLRGRFLLSAVLGAIAGPIAYFAGSSLGAIELGDGFSPLMIALQWSVAMPLLMWIAVAEPFLRSSSLILDEQDKGL